MKKLYVIIVGLLFALSIPAQSITGKVVVDSIYSAALENPEKPPFYTDLSFEYDAEGNMAVNQEALRLWQQEMPLYMLDEYADNLKKLNVLKIDWGRNEEHLHIPITARAFSEKLENMGVEHCAEEYIGMHTNKISTDDGRILQDMLPFFDRFLVFENNNR